MKRLLLFLATASFMQVKAQEYIPNYLLEDNDFITDNFEVLDSSGWFIALPESPLDELNFIPNYKEYFGMGDDDDFTEVRVTDDNNYSFMSTDDRLIHARYNQTYKGVKVEYAELFIHSQDGIVRFLNAKLAESLDMPVIPALTEAEALNAAIEHLGDDNEYSWLDPDYEAAYKDEMQDSNATTYPEGEVLIAKKNVDRNYSAEEFVLAWKFRVISFDPEFDITIYIDANTGEFIKQYSNLQNGQADLSYGYGNNKYIDTRWRGGTYSHHVLRSDDAGAPKIWTKKWAGTNRRFGGYNCILGINCTHNSFDANDDWLSDRAAETTPHWAATHSWMLQ